MTDSYTGADLRALLKEQALLEETMALASWDQLTGMPKDSGEFRAELQSYLTEKYLGVSTGDQAKALVNFLTMNKLCLRSSRKIMSVMRLCRLTSTLRLTS